jgi:hypothetical protein
LLVRLLLDRCSLLRPPDVNALEALQCLLDGKAYAFPRATVVAEVAELMGRGLERSPVGPAQNHGFTFRVATVPDYSTALAVETLVK